MKYRIGLIAIVIVLANSAYAGGWDDFAKGFAEGAERKQCERDYSPSMCNQMEADKEERKLQARRDRQVQADLQQMRNQINQIEADKEVELRNKRYLESLHNNAFTPTNYSY